MPTFTNPRRLTDRASLIDDRAVTLLLMAVAAGCGGGPDGKYQVHGNVTWNGESLESGTITFFPDGAAAPEAGNIVDGRFGLRSHPGNCRVVIRAQRMAGMIDSMNQPRIEQFIPREYNVETTLSVEVTGDGDNTFTFALTGDDPPSKP